VHVVNETKKLLSSQFEMKDIDEAYVILGIKIRRQIMVFLYVILIILTKC